MLGSLAPYYCHNSFLNNYFDLFFPKTRKHFVPKDFCSVYRLFWPLKICYIAFFLSTMVFSVGYLSLLMLDDLHCHECSIMGQVFMLDTLSFFLLWCLIMLCFGLSTLNDLHGHDCLTVDQVFMLDTLKVIQPLILLQGTNACKGLMFFIQWVGMLLDYLLNNMQLR